jgi:ubiquinone/menaquinone biosynthesis C-methylase UbiE
MAHIEQMDFVNDVKSMYPNYFYKTKVLEIGSLNINGSVRFLFETSDYTGVDVVEGPGVDVVGIAHLLNFKDEMFDVVISCESLEHDMYWKETLATMLRVVRKNGLIVITCATGARPEHGTRRTSPEDSGTTAFESWQDYYKNISKRDILSILTPQNFSCQTFKFARMYQDLYFYGIKSG